MVLINRKRILTWLSSLEYNPNKDSSEWTWRELAEYNYVECDREFRAIQFIKKDMSEGRLIFFQVDSESEIATSRIEETIKFLTTEDIRRKRHIEVK